MSAAGIEEAVKDLNPEQLAKLASYIRALHATQAGSMIALTHLNSG